MKLFGGRTSANRFATLAGPMLPILMILGLTACGVKSDLVKPNGQPTARDQNDPSKPPYPIGR